MSAILVVLTQVSHAWIKMWYPIVWSLYIKVYELGVAQGRARQIRGGRGSEVEIEGWMAKDMSRQRKAEHRYQQLRTGRDHALGSDCETYAAS